ncbi:hypothetical protein BDV12DRAFT_170085 [Aspergillus spectabilis]
MLLSAMLCIFVSVRVVLALNDLSFEIAKQLRQEIKWCDHFIELSGENDGSATCSIILDSKSSPLDEDSPSISQYHPQQAL